MHYSRFQVFNYKSYLAGDWLQLKQGFNVVAGQNNVGKTALLQALALRFGDIPHRSLQSCPTPTTAPNPHSWVSFTLTISQQELRDVLFLPITQFYLPEPHPDSDVVRALGEPNAAPDFPNRFL